MRASGRPPSEAPFAHARPAYSGRAPSIRACGMRRDTIRLLHKQSQKGYTDRPELAVRREPEAVPAEYQRELSRAAWGWDEIRRERARRTLADTRNYLIAKLQDHD